MKNKRTLIVTSLLCLAPIVIGLLLWDKLPNEVPTHFDFYGNPDRYSSKTFAIFGLPGFILLVNLIVNIALDNDPKNIGQNNLMMNVGKWISPFVALTVAPLSYLVALGYDINIVTFTSFMVGFVFILVGNYMPKVKQNYTIGIKIPWTLDSEVNWNRTHRFAGYVWIIAGIVMIMTIFIKREWIEHILVAIILVTVLLPTLYSYILYKKDVNK